ncbi:MAG: alpha/beta hydrolase [Nitriliruptoraceae bacterium]|nr:alpha/beta hydrolase [Nitriliruptoraceae bacterium]
MSGPATSPALRTRLVRRGLIASLCAIRSVGAGGTPAPDASVEELTSYALKLRSSMEEMAARAPAGRRLRVQRADDAPVPSTWVTDERGLEGALAAPADEPWRDVERVVLHLHGGAYVLGSAATHRGLAAAMSRSARAAVLLPEYRLAPEHTFPAAADDAFETYRWLIDRVDPAHLAVSGDSAGGGLAAGLLVRVRDAGLPLPACFVGMSPWMDLAATGASMQELAAVDPWLTAELVVPAARAYAGEAALDDPRVSPLYAELAGLPPMLVHVGSDEILLDDATRFVARARAAGVDASVGRFTGLWHVFHAFPVPEARQAVREIGGFIRRHTGTGPAAAPGRRTAA